MKKKKGFSTNKQWEGYVFLAPWIIGLLAFTVIPMIMSLYFSFTKYSMLTPPEWIGFDNFINLFKDRNYIASLRVTSTYVLLSVPLQLVFALLLAVMLKRDRPGIRAYRALYYLPSLFGGSVAISILWRELFNKEGALNQILRLFGIQGRNWIASPDTVLYTIVLLAAWQFGGTMVIFLGGLKQINTELYESASIDGAGKVKSFFKITLPLLTPIVFFNLVMTVIGAFQAFTPAFLISNGKGGPLNATMFYSLYLYIKGFTQFHMGYAAAMAWVLLAIVAVVTRFMFWAADKWVYYDN